MIAQGDIRQRSVGYSTGTDSHDILYGGERCMHETALTAHTPSGQRDSYDKQLQHVRQAAKQGLTD